MLRVLTKISVSLTAFFFLFLVIAEVLSLTLGINISADASGSSMDPTIKDGTLYLWTDRVPFEELKVGDIIIYRKWADVTEDRYAVVSLTIHIAKEGEEIPTEEEPEPTYQSDTIEYKPDEYVMHRIVEIHDGPERYLLTQGDNNTNVDPRPTFQSGYVGVVKWYMNYIGWPNRIMYHYRGFYVLLGITMVLCIAFIIQWSEKNPAPTDESHSSQP